MQECKNFPLKLCLVGQEISAIFVKNPSPMDKKSSSSRKKIFRDTNLEERKKLLKEKAQHDDQLIAAVRQKQRTIVEQLALLDEIKAKKEQGIKL